jgi:hypothetical protein
VGKAQQKVNVHLNFVCLQDLIALGPGGRDGSVFLLDRNRRRKRKPDWLQNSVDLQRMAVPCAALRVKARPRIAP